MTYETKNIIVSSYSQWFVATSGKYTHITDGAGVSNHQIVDISSKTYYGAAGMGPCIGVVIFSKRGNIIAGFHFSNANYETKTLYQYKWPEDSVAVIAGGDNSPSSVLQLKRVIVAVNKLNIRLLGISPTENIYCDSTGHWFTKKNIYK